jgi:uncharacterized protein YcbK (DUF882 family)
MTCLAATIGLICALNVPPYPEPQLFHHGKATNRATYGINRFVPELPLIGPVIASVKPSDKAPGLAVLSYRSNSKHRTKTSCFPPRLVRILRDVERHFKAPVIVTSGYRTPRHNRRVGGVRGSMHLQCKAADIKVPGVSKKRLHTYLMRHPKRGGVGLYRRWETVHIDVGRKRNWYWR